MKVSVLMITYNHEKYLAQALDSALMQEVNFPFEIVLGEDCSTDGTRTIAIEYQRRYPDKIRLLLPESNLGMMPNFIATLKACRGEFIALLEGDDYWTSQKKLQKQVDFLEANRSCSICFNPTKVVHEDGTAPYVFPSEVKDYYDIEDLLHDNFMHTCSVLFRNGLIKEFPGWYMESVAGDYPLHLLNAGSGKIGCIDEVMSAYRVHSNGVWSMQFEKNFLRNVTSRIAMYRNIDQHYKGKYHRIIRIQIFLLEFTLYKRAQKDGDLFGCLKQLLILLTNYPLQVIQRKRDELFSRCSGPCHL